MRDICYSQIPDETQLYQMDFAELKNLLEKLKKQIEKLDELEPDDMMTQEYDIWGDKHEKLEDLIEIICEILDEK